MSTGEAHTPRWRLVLTLLPLAALEGFLNDFKASTQETLTHALGNVTIDDDDLSDDYDFVDEDDGAQQRRQAEKARRKATQYKYKDLLQKLADRQAEEICIELDDLETVRRTVPVRDFRH